MPHRAGPAQKLVVILEHAVHMYFFGSVTLHEQLAQLTCFYLGMCGCQVSNKAVPRHWALVRRKIYDHSIFMVLEKAGLFLDPLIL